MKLYEILGVEVDASEDEIKKAYRCRSMECHPDRHPDKEEEFKELSQAYEVLSDADKKARYDSGEPLEFLSETSLESMAVSGMCQLFGSIVDSNMDMSFDMNVVTTMTNHITNNVLSLNKKIKNADRAIMKYGKIKEKISHKIEKKDNTLVHMLDAKIEVTNKHINEIKREIKLNEKILELLENYEYDFTSERSTTSDQTNVIFQPNIGDLESE
jgi:curved DNA-binding protein CbpA